VSPSRVLPVLRRHWLAAALIILGFALRVLAQIGYQPALIYVDSLKYLYNIYPGSDPLGYEAPLKAILLIGNLAAVAAVQHLLGLAIAVTLYLVLLRRQVPRWLAAVAIAPVLLDGYQIQIEQNIMPDVWFEAAIVAGIAVLLLRPATGLRVAATAGLLLGSSATFRQVGEILLLPALLYLIVVGGGFERVFNRCVVFTAAFAVPIVGYMIGSSVLTGHFQLASATPSLSTYGRLVTAANCHALRIPAYERPLCPTKRQLGYGIDWLDHDIHSPLKSYQAPPGMNRYAVISGFDHQIVLQQPGRVLAAVFRDGLKLFSLTRTSSQGGTPIARWQFQVGYPTYPPWVRVRPGGTIVLALPPRSGQGPWTRIEPGQATVIRPVAAFLRGYQLGGGYTPGPLFLLATLAGLSGSVLVLVRRRGPLTRELTLACLLFFGSAAAILAMSDVFEFTWRYQLPALVTLPPAGALGVAAWLSLRGRRAEDGTGQPSQEPSEVEAQAV
jgi:hypothetical protein